MFMVGNGRSVLCGSTSPIVLNLFKLLGHIGGSGFIGKMSLGELGKHILNGILPEFPVIGLMRFEQAMYEFGDTRCELILWHTATLEHDTQISLCFSNFFEIAF